MIHKYKLHEILCLVCSLIYSQWHVVGVQEVLFKNESMHVYSGSVCESLNQGPECHRGVITRSLALKERTTW